VNRCGVGWCGVVWCGDTWCTPKSSFSPRGKLAREWKTAKYAKSVMTRATDEYCTCHVGERERRGGEVRERGGGRGFVEVRKQIGPRER